MLRKQSIILWRWLLVGMWMLIIFLFSSQPYSGQSTEKVFGIFNLSVRKAAHAFEYAALFFLVRRAWASILLRKVRWWMDILAFGFCLTYAFFDEWYQAFIPGRSSALRDVGIDCLGTVLALMGLKILRFLPPIKKHFQ